MESHICCTYNGRHCLIVYTQIRRVLLVFAKLSIF
nr:MAG TPA: hypothetical protein [Caudoviricetes sp.]